MISSHDEMIISLSDLKRLFFRLLPQLKRVAILSLCAALFFLVMKEPRYVAQASFKQATRSGGEGFRLKELFQGAGFNAGESSIISIMQSRAVLRTVVEELGLQVEQDPGFLLTRVMGKIWNNFAAELKRPLSHLDPFVFREVKYTNENACTFYVKPIDSAQFELLDEHKKSLGKWKLHEKISLPSFEGVLTQMPKNIRYLSSYRLHVNPWTSAVDALRKSFEIKTFKADKNIFNLTFMHRDRLLAPQVLNQIIANYQNYLRQENEDLIGSQVHYLQTRQDELAKSWDEALQEHVAYLKSNIGSGGYFSLHQEMKMLSEPQTSFTSKLFHIDLEMKRLEGVAPVLASFQLEQPKRPSPLLERQKIQLNQALMSVQWKEEKMSLLQEKLKKPKQHTHESQEFAALTLDTAQQLYLAYNRSRDKHQAKLKQLIYLLKEIPRPDFELSSITTILSDPVTLDMVHKASATAISLNDSDNRSVREQEHLKGALDTQKLFISHHVEQTIELTHLHIKLIEDKLASLQQTTLELLRQEKELIEQKLRDISHQMKDIPDKWRKENLLALKKELGTRMIEGLTHLTESKNIDQHLYQVGSKVLDASLVPTAPKSPHLLIYSLVISFFSVGAYYCLQLCRSLFRGLPVSHETLLLSGFRSLGKLSSHCTTMIDEMQGSDLETLRRLSQFLKTLPIKNPCCALIGGKNPDYSSNLASLLAMQGLKVLLVHYVLDTLHPSHIPGLWQYLNNEISDVPIRSSGAFDFLPTGATSRHAAEMLGNPKFLSFVQEMKTGYDLVLIYSKSPPQFAEAHALFSLADATIVAADEEKEKISPLTRQILAQCLSVSSPRMVKKKRIVVTGGAGFLGSHLCERLLQGGDAVCCVDNLYTGSEDNLVSFADHPHFTLMHHNICEPLHIEADEIYNLACPASPIHYQSDPVQTIKTNVHGAINMLDLARELQATIFQASTSEVYGDPHVHPQTESYWGNVNPIGLRSCYDEGKRCAETLFFDYHRQYGLKIKVARIFNTYGPRMHPNDGRVVSNLIVQALQGAPITIYGDGRQTRSFCYVDDLIEGIIRLMHSKERFTGPVNLGNPIEFQILALAQQVLELTGSTSEIIFRPLPSDDPKQRKPDISLAQKELGWEPHVSLREGLMATIAYFDKVLSRN